ncbi:hypothetical protein GCM10010377_82680 [Streptomyces viridiviolaceus]|uniref:Uncharacterized protein n=1 Tax=Streptomyces viridiviolaceus TaxID=68282 RepID=A0ABW2EA21_9ACTN|nr:hypothetical protein [Streptomyces viridiviolaceus]GHB80273.1 hypothetical protein GCM10010377_82680 [Streptomyces viridiviolaceus]
MTDVRIEWRHENAGSGPARMQRAAVNDGPGDDTFLRLTAHRRPCMECRLTYCPTGRQLVDAWQAIVDRISG